uniref:CYP867E3 n=1 Tax=Taxus chinensis TaxID=29808 RepID=A0A291FAZ2_TAXCH|nr:CYP867E3 [Taxus chinensis]
MALDAATIVVLALAALFIIVRYRTTRRQNLKAPRPPSWPIIGHLHLLRQQKRPLHRILSSLSESYGPIMHLQLGFRPLLVISSSDLAKQCFTTNDKAFASRPRLSKGKHMGYGNKNFSQAPYGSFWRNLRKMCTLHIFSATRIESFKQVRVEEISALIRSLFDSCQREGTPANIKSRLSDLTFNIMLRMVASKKLSEAVYSEDLQEARHFKDTIEEAFLLVGAFDVGDYLPFLNWLDLQGLKSAMKKLQKKRDAFLQKLLKDHREKRGFQPKDLIDFLISATDNHEIQSDSNDDVVKATALGVISAGTDTSSVTIEWALAALLQHPHVLSKAQEELDTHVGRERVIEEADLQELKYLQAIVKETLRLYPAGPLLVPHESTEDCSVGGYHVPAGTRLLVNAWAIQRDPAVWERPTEFDPERFLKGEREIDVKGQDFELIPFGSGRRMCPGMSLALIVVTQTLGRLLQSFEWSIPAGTTIDMREGFGLTMPKAVPLKAMIIPRIPLHFY